MKKLLVVGVTLAMLLMGCDGESEKQRAEDAGKTEKSALQTPPPEE